MLDDVHAVLLDLDGVLYVEGEPISGASRAVAELRDRGFKLRFVTNTTARSRAQTLDKLEGLGFGVESSELVTPALLARRYCEAEGHRRVALIMNDHVKEDFEGMDVADRDVDAVIVGDLGDKMGYPILNEAFRLVMDGAELLALQKNRFWLTADGLSLDAGPFVAALEYATGQPAMVMGKPAPAFFSTVLEDLGERPTHAAMVGDDVESDVGGALEAGLGAILVRTGKYRADFVARSGVHPTATVDSIAQVPGLLGRG